MPKLYLIRCFRASFFMPKFTGKYTSSTLNFVVTRKEASLYSQATPHEDYGSIPCIVQPKNKNIMSITLKPQPCSSYFTIPKLGDRPAESFSYAELQGTDDDGNDEYTDDGVQIDLYTSPIDGRVFKFKTIWFDMEHWTEEQIEDFYAEWNTNIDSLILLNQ